MIVYDLDGTLVDTREAVRRAYEHAGVVMPEDAWGQPWWLWTDYRTHARKNDVYPAMLERYARPLPLLMHALRTQAPVITGASQAAVAAVTRLFCCAGLNVQLVAASRAQKAFYLEAMIPLTPFRTELRDAVYVDDDETARTFIKERTLWEAISPEECLRSFWPQERTPG